MLITSIPIKLDVLRIIPISAVNEGNILTAQPDMASLLYVPSGFLSIL